jgi:V/A-type H+-transporting ATPase subunit E
VPYEDLIQSVETSARERMKELTERAQTEAEKRLNEVRTHKEEITNKYMESARRSVEIERIKSVSQANEEIKMKIYRIKDEIFQKAFQEAERRLQSLRDTPDYERVLQKLTLEALTELGSSEGTIHINPQDEPLCRKILKEAGVNSEIVADPATSAGLEVQSRDGSITILNTFDTRLKRAKELLRPEVFSLLFGD